MISDLTLQNKNLLARRDELQGQIDTWHKKNQGNFDFTEYKEFLKGIGYLEPEVGDFTITTQRVDSEVAAQAGPQLVVPATNARYAINAANARWGSLYDALYGTDAISYEGAECGKGYDPVRGERVIAFARDFLNQTVPLMEQSHKEVIQYIISGAKLKAKLGNGEITELKDNSKFVGYLGSRKRLRLYYSKIMGSTLKFKLTETTRSVEMIRLG
ncbi:hypothetical protein N752_08255 [Desulforamulus aquiferis]|nr:hypothetical protein [Desulforamulus aquiferis]RYD05877.1 hypothetical protein N752_08255 [Desulforamulus aquiferis]